MLDRFGHPIATIDVSGYYKANSKPLNYDDQVGREIEYRTLLDFVKAHSTPKVGARD